MKTSFTKFVAILLLGGLIVFSACSSEESNPMDPNDTGNGNVAITISPPAVTVAPGGTQQFSAQVNGSSNQSVTWSVSGGPGTITADGLYSAPNSIAGDSVSATVTAVPAADPSLSATADILVRKVTNVTVGVTPATASIAPGQTQQFSATVTGAGNTAVTWTVISGEGTIDGTGLYSAPATISGDSIMVVVQATSVEEPAASGTATLTVGQDASPSPDNLAFAIQIMPSTNAELGEALVLSVEAVYLASQLNGGTTVITTGTLTETSPQNFSYSATPSDRLRLELQNGFILEIIVSTMVGDFSISASDFLEYDHEYTVQLIVPGSLDLQVTHTRSNGNLANSVAGTVTLNGGEHTVNLSSSGFTFFDTGGSFAEYESEETFTGTISGPSINANINEFYRYKSIFNSSENRFIENVTREVNHSWSENGSSFEAQNVLIRTAFLNGKPTDVSSFWIAEGSVFQDGSLVGQVTWETQTAAIEIFIALLSGDRVTLETHPL